MGRTILDTDAAGDTLGYHALFVDTSLDTHLAVLVNDSETISDLKRKILHEHPLCFPHIGKITISALKVKRRGKFYHLPEAMFVKSAFTGLSNRFIFVDASSLESDAKDQRIRLNDFAPPSEKDVLPDGPSKMTTNGNSLLLPVGDSRGHPGPMLSTESGKSGKEISSCSEMELRHTAAKQNSIELQPNASQPGLDGNTAGDLVLQERGHDLPTHSMKVKEDSSPKQALQTSRKNRIGKRKMKQEENNNVEAVGELTHHENDVNTQEEKSLQEAFRDLVRRVEQNDPKDNDTEFDRGAQAGMEGNLRDYPELQEDILAKQAPEASAEYKKSNSKRKKQKTSDYPSYGENISLNHVSESPSAALETEKSLGDFCKVSCVAVSNGKVEQKSPANVSSDVNKRSALEHANVNVEAAGELEVELKYQGNRTIEVASTSKSATKKERKVQKKHSKEAPSASQVDMMTELNKEASLEEGHNKDSNINTDEIPTRSLEVNHALTEIPRDMKRKARKKSAGVPTGEDDSTCEACYPIKEAMSKGDAGTTGSKNLERELGGVLKKKSKKKSSKLEGDALNSSSAEDPVSRGSADICGELETSMPLGPLSGDVSVSKACDAAKGVIKKRNAGTTGLKTLEHESARVVKKKSKRKSSKLEGDALISTSAGDPVSRGSADICRELEASMLPLGPLGGDHSSSKACDTTKGVIQKRNKLGGDPAGDAGIINTKKLEEDPTRDVKRKSKNKSTEHLDNGTALVSPSREHPLDKGSADICRDHEASMPLGPRGGNDSTSRAPYLFEEYKGFKLGRDPAGDAGITESGKLKHDSGAGGRAGTEIHPTVADKAETSSRIKKKSRKAKNPAEGLLGKSVVEPTEESGVDVSSVEPAKATNDNGLRNRAKDVEPDCVIKNVLESLEKNAQNQEDSERTNSKSMKKSKKRRIPTEKKGPMEKQHEIEPEVKDTTVTEGEPPKNQQKSGGEGAHHIFSDSPEDNKIGRFLDIRTDDALEDGHADETVKSPHKTDTADVDDNFSLKIREGRTAGVEMPVRVGNNIKAAESEPRSKKEGKTLDSDPGHAIHDQQVSIVAVEKQDNDGKVKRQRDLLHSNNDETMVHRNGKPKEASEGRPCADASDEVCKSNVFSQNISNLGASGKKVHSRKGREDSVVSHSSMESYRNRSCRSNRTPAPVRRTSRNKNNSRLSHVKASGNARNEMVNKFEDSEKMLPMSGLIFKPADCWNSNEGEKDTSSARASSDVLSDSSDDDSNASCKSDGYNAVHDKENTIRSAGDWSGGISLEKVFRSSSRFKKARLMASQSQHEDDDYGSLPFDCVPDSQPN